MVSCDAANNQLDIATTETDSKYESNSKDAGQPRWLLVLEIFTGAVVLVFVITLLCTVIRKFKPKFMMMVPWKKPTKSRDKRVITVGRCSNFLLNLFLFKYFPCISSYLFCVLRWRYA